jgi:hypothetical protein
MRFIHFIIPYTHPVLPATSAAAADFSVTAVIFCHTAASAVAAILL